MFIQNAKQINDCRNRLGLAMPRDIDSLIAALDADQTGIFWG